MAAEKPALLVALSRYPTALETGSAILIHHNLVALAERYAIHLVCRGERPAAVAAGDDLAAACHAVEFTGRERSWVPKPLRAPIRALAPAPPSITGLRSKATRARVESLVRTGRFAALLLYDLGTVQYGPDSFAARTIACIEDPQSLRLERMAALPVWSAFERFRLHAAARRMRRYERHVLPRLGRVILLSEADARDMAAADGYRNLGAAPYPIRMPAREVNGMARADGSVVFSGNMYAAPNVDAALWLLSAIFPRVLQKHPAATLRIVGARPDPRIVAAAARLGGRVEVTGRVPDVAEHVRRARVSVCPVRLGIGVQTKVVEAMALGTPVVSTSAGNRGVGARPGEEISVGDDADDFADQVALLLHGEGWDRLSANGRRLVAERFSVARSALAMVRHIEALAGTGALHSRTPAVG